MTAPRGIRNRNPGNIVLSTWTMKQDGCVGPEPQGRFAVFDTMANGVKALLRLLLVYRDQHKLKTVRGIINRWAPPSENDTSAYSITVAKAIGVGLDDPLPADADTYIRLARAIVIHENGRDAAVAVTDEDYAQAAASVFLQAGRSSPSAEQVGDSGASPSPTPASATQPDRTDGSPAFLQPPWPFTRSTMSLPIALLAPVLGKLVEILPWFSSGSKSAERNVKAAQELAPILVEGISKVLPQAPNVQAGVEQILADPDLQRQFVAAVAPQADQMIVVWEQTSENVAAARSAELEFLSSGYSFHRSPSFWVAMLLLPLVYMVVVSMMFVGPWLPDWPFEARTNIAGLIVGMIIGGLMGYYFGMMTSRNRVAQATK